MARCYKIQNLTPGRIASICDHTFLQPAEAYREKADQIKGNAVELRKKDFYNFLDSTLLQNRKPYAVCVRSEDVLHARDFFCNRWAGIKIASVIGFPEGAWFSLREKIEQMKLVSGCGASEVDFVMNYQSLNRGNFSEVYNEVSTLTNAAHNLGMLAKLILETSQLTNKKISEACNIAEKTGADFVKTSTGYAGGGAKAEHLKIMREDFSRGIKLSGGIKSENIYELLKAASGRADGYIELDPLKIRIGESSLLSKIN